MPLVAWIASLWGGLMRIAPSLVGQVLISLGISVVTYSGVSTSITWLKTQALTSINGLPADLVSLLSYLGVGQCISIIFSAMAVRMTLSGIAGASKGFVKK